MAATLSKLAREGKFDAKKAQAAMAELGVDAESGDPAHAVGQPVAGSCACARELERTGSAVAEVAGR